MRIFAPNKALSTPTMSSPATYNSFEEYPTYDAHDLELLYTPQKSTFKIWSPVAESVRLRLYDEGLGGTAFAVHPMEPESNGTWACEVNADLIGKFYTFQVKYEGEWLNETPGIYAKAVGVSGKRAAIIDLRQTNPAGWENDRRPEQKEATDAILYEIHVRDFSADPEGGMQHRGKFLAFTETGTTNPYGQKTGLDHLTELGITHIHLLDEGISQFSVRHRTLIGPLPAGVSAFDYQMIGPRISHKAA